MKHLDSDLVVQSESVAAPFADRIRAANSEGARAAVRLEFDALMAALLRQTLREEGRELRQVLRDHLEEISIAAQTFDSSR